MKERQINEHHYFNNLLVPMESDITDTEQCFSERVNESSL